MNYKFKLLHLHNNPRLEPLKLLIHLLFLMSRIPTSAHSRTLLHSGVRYDSDLFCTARRPWGLAMQTAVDNQIQAVDAVIAVEVGIRVIIRVAEATAVGNRI